MAEKINQDHTIDPSLQQGITLQADAERLGFDALQEPGAVSETLEMFQADRLLVRGIDGPQDRRDGMNFRVVDNELEYMAEDGGMQHASSTLLVKGENVSVYKPFGFLMDSERVEVEHVSERDSLASTDNDGNLKVTGEDLGTVAELARRIRETHSREMNEINITVPEDALRGLFTTNYSRPKMDALVTRNHIQRQGKGTLPLFVYDQEQGALQPWDPNADEIAGILDTLGERTRQYYAKELSRHAALAQSVGLTAVEAMLG